MSNASPNLRQRGGLYREPWRTTILLVLACLAASYLLEFARRAEDAYPFARVFGLFLVLLLIFNHLTIFYGQPRWRALTTTLALGASLAAVVWMFTA